MNALHRIQMERAGLVAEVTGLRRMVADVLAHMAAHRGQCGDPLEGYVGAADVAMILRAGGEQAALDRASAMGQFRLAEFEVPDREANRRELIGMANARR